ncbi:hypothetical protein [Pontibacter sp. HSC-36F09]|uniref:hypothetical protein n=1 Tax=Pontibacter sp. HSC-36F09 TaxID=2910966 RepID=UPI0020A03616|nr:hypothetical protein [Pontibacter sp. HSC-36F09]MCP2042121.1 hypothetical protein [Pontibacter sp. HSC-36F09]
MKTLNWRHTGWFAKDFIFTMEQQIIGNLTIDSSWNFKALYTDEETKLNFAQKSFWDRNVSITRDGEVIGEIHSGLFGEKTLRLVSGEKFTISTSLWEQEVYWKTEEGNTVVQYWQATMSSMGKGSISLEKSLPVEMEKLLISSGLFIRQMTRWRRARKMAVIILVIASGSQF